MLTCFLAILLTGSYAVMLLAAIGSMLLQFFISMRSRCMTPTARCNAYNPATLNVLI